MLELAEMGPGVECTGIFGRKGAQTSKRVGLNAQVTKGLAHRPALGM